MSTRTVGTGPWRSVCIAMGFGFGLSCLLATQAIATDRDYTVTIVALEGSSMPDGDGNIGLPNDVSVNDNGDWLADVNVSGGSVSRALIVNGQVWVKPGEAIDPNDEVSSVANALKHMNSHGDIAWRPGLDDQHSGMYLNFTPLIIRNDISTATAFNPGTEYTGIFRGRVTNDQQVAMIATLSEPDVGTIRAIVWLAEDGMGGVTEEVLIKRFEDAPGIGGGVTIDTIQTSADNFALSSNGDVLWTTTLGGTTTDINGALYRNHELLVRKGDPSPVGGDAYDNVGAGTFRLDINDTGGYVFTGSLAGHASGPNVIVKDVGNGHEVVALRGEAAPDLDGVRTIDSLGGVQAFVSNDGDVVWYSRFSGDSSTNQGLYVNDRLILQKGVTTIGGLTLDAVCGTTATSNGISNSLMASPNGRYIILRARFTNGQRGVLLVEFDEPEPECFFADLTCDGVVDIFDLLEVLANWGPCKDPADCPADITGDGVVDIFDLLEVLANWGPVP